MRIFIFLSMIFCHIIDDYKIQAGVLNSLKTKSWWKENAPESLYKYDYITGLTMHSLSWSFMIMLPIAIYLNFNITPKFVIAYILNSIVHGVVDDQKANRHSINLIVDQSIHIVQIVVTAVNFLL